MRQEHVILLNEQDQPCGTLEKYAAHTATTPLHSAFSCWIFNEQGQLLVTRRSLHKKAWPGVWTNSVCGHPQLGETNEAAIVRRARFELGADINLLTPVYADFRYRVARRFFLHQNAINFALSEGAQKTHSAQCKNERKECLLMLLLSRITFVESRQADPIFESYITM
ncbi:isopentenyl-diphosphate Delta-isomerase [Citrobacter freundii]